MRGSLAIPVCHGGGQSGGGRSLCSPSGGKILETCYLTDSQKRLICQISKEEGVDFVKTPTGFGPAGATAADVQLMRAVVGPAMGVNAAVKIRDLTTTLAMIEAGANRIGTSAEVAIIEKLKAIQAQSGRGRCP